MSARLLEGLGRLPLSVLYPMSYAFYLLLFHVTRARRRVVVRNLSAAFPQAKDDDIRQLSRDFYRNYSDVLMEMIASVGMPAEMLDRRVRLLGGEAVREHIQNGQSVLVTAAHHCNIEWLLLSLGVKLDLPVAAIYRPLHNAAMESLMRQTYTRFGGELIADREVIKELMGSRDRARIITIVPDHSPNRDDDTHWTRFMGRETGFFMAPDTIAKFLRLPVYFAAMRRERRGYYEVQLQALGTPPYAAKNPAIVERYVRTVEAQIRSAPADWFWMHRRWKHNRPLYG